MLEEAVASRKSRPANTIRNDQAVIGGVRGGFADLENRAARVVYNNCTAIHQTTFVTEKYGVGVGERIGREGGVG